MALNDVYSQFSPNGEEFTRCAHCGYQNCDVRVVNCKCAFHARCIAIPRNGPLKHCPACRIPATGLVLFGMSFREIDEARKTTTALANNSKRNRKRKGHAFEENNFFDSEGKNYDPSERRSGRWTKEEMNYVDELIKKFESGELPLKDGLKLNDFLSNILKSKQSRLTKKMKNAKLSTRSFQCIHGFIADSENARRFSSLEDAFFHSIQCHQERAEIKFYMQKEWRELFSSFCVASAQNLDAHNWLSTVEEMDRRENLAKDALRMAKRKMMLGRSKGSQVMDNISNSFGTINENGGIRSDSNGVTNNLNTAHNSLTNMSSTFGVTSDGSDCSLKSFNAKNAYNDTSTGDNTIDGTHENKDPSSFLSRVLIYIQQNEIPFEHVDAWVPSFVPGNTKGNSSNGSSNPMCRLCYGGSITSNTHYGDDDRIRAMTPKELSNLKAFAEYSEKFSFDIGCGLPGRVYQSGVPTWEQSVQNAPTQHFQRSNAAKQWGIKTSVGIPVPSPNVGRIVITLYSQHDREKDQDMVVRLCDEFTKLAPCPRWKLVIELGEDICPAPQAEDLVGVEQQEIPLDPDEVKDSKDSRIAAVVSLLGEYMPSNPSSQLASYIPGFMAMRLMMLKPSWTDLEKEVVQTLVASYSSYSDAGRSKAEVAVLLARDCMFLIQQQPQFQTQYQSMTPSPLQTSQPSSLKGSTGYVSNYKSFI